LIWTTWAAGQPDTGFQGSQQRKAGIICQAPERRIWYSTKWKLWPGSLREGKPDSFITSSNAGARVSLKFCKRWWCGANRVLAAGSWW